MKSGRMMVCAVLFMGLTAAKFFFPEQAAAFRLRVGELMTKGVDYRYAVETMGRGLAEEGISRELIAALAGHGGAPEGGERSDGGDGSGALKSAVEDTDMDRAVTDAMGLSLTEPEIPEAVSAFLEAQAAFEGYSLPDNVSADMPVLPFATISPVAGYNSSGFGYREHPIEGIVKFHYGTDFAANEGEPVCAFADGTVYAAGTSAGYGNYLILTHEGGYASLYAHMSQILAEEGTQVSRGDRIGLVGHTGYATGPHLHFELLLNDVYLNPEYYL